MKWDLVRTTAEHELYHLFDNDKKILSLELNAVSNSARVECNNEKRVFLLRKEGMRRNKTVIRNEYGIKLGEFGNEGQLSFFDINNERFYFTIQADPPELRIFKEPGSKAIISCKMDDEEQGSGIQLARNKTLSKLSHPGLMMAVCWYLFLPVTKEEPVVG